MKRLYRIKKRTSIFLINYFLSGTHFFALKRALLNSCEGISIGINTKIVGPIHVDGTMVIGDNSWIGRDFSLDGNGKVTIGNDCDLAPGVQILTGSHLIGSHDRRAGQGFNGNIEIGNGCWIGAGSKIVTNVKIGSGVVVAAGAVVAHDVSMDVLVGGVPAKVIRQLQ